MLMQADIDKIFIKMPILETQRLILRKMSVSDSTDMFEYAGQDKVTQYLLWSSHDCEEHTRQYLELVEREYRRGKMYDWAVEYKENGKMIGTSGFTKIDTANKSGEVGYVLNPEYWGRGLAKEAVDQLLSFGFDLLELNRIEARFMSGNEASYAVMIKCGMTFEGIARSKIYVKGKFRDVGTCAILKDEYYQSHEKKNYTLTETTRWFSRLW